MLELVCRHLDPTQIPPQDRDVHLVGLNFFPDTNPFPTLAAIAQHLCPEYMANSRHRLAVVEEGTPPEILDNEELGEQRGGGA
eukprot:1160358-Pelagomonas_calceolata.AAC.1